VSEKNLFVGRADEVVSLGKGKTVRATAGASYASLEVSVEDALGHTPNIRRPFSAEKKDLGSHGRIVERDALGRPQGRRKVRAARALFGSRFPTVAAALIANHSARRSTNSFTAIASTVTRKRPRPETSRALVAR